MGQLCLLGSRHIPSNVRASRAADAGKGPTRERDYRDVDGLITDEPDLSCRRSTRTVCRYMWWIRTPRHRNEPFGLERHGGAHGERSLCLPCRRHRHQTRGCGLRGRSVHLQKDCYEVSADGWQIFSRRNFRGMSRRFWQRSEKNSVGWLTQTKIPAGSLEGERDHFSGGGRAKRASGSDGHLYLLQPKLLFFHRASHGKRGNLGGFLYLK